MVESDIEARRDNGGDNLWAERARGQDGPEQNILFLNTESTGEFVPTGPDALPSDYVRSHLHGQRAAAAPRGAGVELLLHAAVPRSAPHRLHVALPLRGFLHEVVP